MSDLISRLNEIRRLSGYRDEDMQKGEPMNTAVKCIECKHYVGRSDAGLCTANGALKKVPFYISKYHTLCQGYNYTPKEEKESKNGTDSN